MIFRELVVVRDEIYWVWIQVGWSKGGAAWSDDDFIFMPTWGMRMWSGLKLPLVFVVFSLITGALFLLKRKKKLGTQFKLIIDRLVWRYLEIRSRFKKKNVQIYALYHIFLLGSTYLKQNNSINRNIVDKNYAITAKPHFCCGWLSSNL